jgi:hypothetical protein
MNDEIKPESEAPAESSLLGVSVRGWMTIIMVVTVCVMSALGMTIGEPLYGAFLLGTGVYLGQRGRRQ